MHKSHRRGALATILLSSLLVALSLGSGRGAAFELGCTRGESASGEGDAGDAGDASKVVDLCDAFTTVGASCPAASPVRCFPMCDAGGCSCRATPKGPEWACVTDLSCLPPCAPIDDACAELIP